MDGSILFLNVYNFRYIFVTWVYEENKREIKIQITEYK